MRPARLSSWVVRRRNSASTIDRYTRNGRRSRRLNLERLEDRTLLATQPFPVPLQGLKPAGSLIDSGSVAGSINTAGDTETYTLALAANQDVSLVLSGTSNLVGSLALRDPGGAIIATATSAGAGQTDVLETAPVTAAGTYSLVVSGGSGSTGGYTLQAYLNAAYKPATESINTRGTAYDLSGAFVGLGTTPYADRAAVVGTSGGSPDFYALNLNAGESATLAVTGTSGQGALVSLVDPSGNTLALGASGAAGVDSLVSPFVAPVTGTYYAEVSGGTTGQAYDLVVTRNADFDTHGGSFDTAQPLDPSNVAVGAITGAGSADWYQFNVNAGDNLVITTTTPGSTSAGGEQFVDNLNPQLQLFDSNDNLVALASGNAADGRNDVIDWTALSSGGYRVLTTSADGTSTGEYTVAIQGATGGSSPFTVSSTTPAAGSDLGSQQSSMTVVFNHSINDSSVAASDISIDGLPATGFTVVNSNTVSFAFPTTTNGVHTVSISGLTDVQGVSLTPDSFTFQTDDIPPSVVSSSIAEGQVLSSGDLTEVVTFSEPINPSSVSASDVLLQGTLRGVGYASASMSFDPTDTILTVNYTNLPTDDYTFTLKAGPANDLSVAGVPMTSSFAVDFTLGVAVGSVQVTSSANPAPPGQPVSFTATVAPSMGGPAPGGDVQFVVDGTDFGSPVPVLSGQATSQTTTTLTPGSHIVVADYLGDANYLPANSPDYPQSIPAADLSITNSGPAMAGAGDPAGFDYTVVVTNNGPSDNAGGITVTDVLPSGLTFVSAGSTPGASIVGQTVTYTNIAGLANRASETFTLHVTVAADVPDETVLDDTASVVSNGTVDANSNNNTSNAVDTTIRASADLSIAASGPATTVAGDPNGFDETLVVTNHGFVNNVGGFTVNDVLPAGLTFQSAGSTAGATVNGATVSFTNTSGLAFGATETFIIHVTLAASVPNGTPLENSAAVVSNGTLDQNPLNNTSNTVDTTATAQADLAVTNTRLGSVSAGQTQTFVVTVTNDGPSDAADVVLSDRLPQNTVIVSETQNSGPSFSVAATTANGGVTLTAANSRLAPGASATFTIVTRLASPEPDGSPLVSIASVASRTADPDLQNNEAIAKALLTNAADLALHLTAGPNPVAPGGTLTYTLTLVNNGPNAAFDVNLRDTLPPNAMLRGVVQTSGPSFAIALPLKGTTGGVLTWSIPILESGESATFFVMVTPASTSHFLTNSAAVTSSTENQNPGDRSAIVVTAVATNSPARVVAAVVPTMAHRTQGGFGRP